MEITPDIEKALASRNPCPFYGFEGIKDPVAIMVGNNGNACALTFKHYPCAMEMDGKQPCWDKCGNFNHDGNRDETEHFLAVATAYPDELKPARAISHWSWKGINAGEWFQMVMGRNFP